MTFNFSLFKALRSLIDDADSAPHADEWRSILALHSSSSSRGAQLDRLALAMLRGEDVALAILRVARPLAPDLLCRLLTRSSPSVTAQLPTLPFDVDARFDVWFQSRAFTAALLLPAMPHTLT